MSVRADHIQNLAATIAGSVQKYVSVRVDNARYDQSYIVKIIGVNVHFTELSAEEQAAVTEAYQIPSIILPGEDNYYTFRLSGELYTIRSKLNFKLGESAALKIPNNNMDQMRLETAAYSETAAESENETVVIAAVEQPEMPERNVQNGDCWAVKGESGIAGLYIYDNEWKPAEPVKSGVQLPTTGKSGEYFVITNGDGDATAVYVRQAVLLDDGKRRYEWSQICPIKNSKRYVLDNYSYPPLKDGYFWAEINDEAEKLLVAMHRYNSENEPGEEWQLLYNSGGGQADVPRLFVQPVEPAGEVSALGDYWLKHEVIDNTPIAKELYKYIENSDGDYLWNKLCEFKSGGVGENVGQHNERFNDYKTNTISGSGDYNHVEGYYNTITGPSSGGYNHVEGNNNTVIGYNIHAEGRQNQVVNTSSFASFVGGANNIIPAALYYSFFYGHNNKYLNGNGSITGSWLTGYNISITCSQITYSEISGDAHSINGDLYSCTVLGSTNKINSSVTSSIIAGSGNTVSGSMTAGSIIAGDSNSISGNFPAGLITGSNNNFLAVEQSIICGYENSGSTNRAFICGAGANVNTDMRICVGNGSAASPSNCFVVKSDGNVYASGSYNAMGADYAEYFEWIDGNPGNEDRRGMLVSLDGDKILPANGDDVFGVISVAPSVVGNSESLGWRGKYKRDIFGTIIYDEEGRPILSDDYDNGEKYIPRSERSEWAAVGLTGRLIVVDDGSCQPNKYCEAKNGIAILSGNKTNVRVLKRIDETHIEVFIK